MDVEREGGICTSAGDTGVGAYADAGAETDAGAGAGDGGGGSLATLVSDGATTGESDGADAGAGWGAGAVAERVGVGTGVEVGATMDTAPVSSETYLSETGFPEKKSPAVREGSMEDAGGKMSDWNESDWVRACVCASVQVRWGMMGGEGMRT